jgi:hypothetical protein
LSKSWKSQCGRHCGYRGEKNVSAIKHSAPSVLFDCATYARTALGYVSADAGCVLQACMRKSG